jgi:serine/threonine protein kinase
VNLRVTRKAKGQFHLDLLLFIMSHMIDHGGNDALERTEQATPLSQDLSTNQNDPYATKAIEPTGNTTPALCYEDKNASNELPSIAGYDVLAEIGRGGMGIVFKARQARLGRIVALKMISYGRFSKEVHRTRFLGEAQAISRLQHPNIIQIHEIGELGGQPYFSLEFVEGGTLAKKLDNVPQAPVTAAKIIETLARAMHVAHQHGIVHRDLKPSNILIAPDGTLKISDFGLAKQLDQDLGQTQTGAILGTPSYMAPEQAAGLARAIGPRTDIYALGAILYEMLTGRPPFRGVSVLATLEQVRSQEVLAPRRLLKVPRDIEAISLKCLEKDPRKRYGTSLELAEDLNRFLLNQPTKARSPGLIARISLWCQRPDRIREAGTFLIFISIVLSIWNVSGIIISGYLYMNYPSPGRARLQLTVLLFGLYLPYILIGYETTKQKLWAVRAAAILGFGTLILTVGAICNIPWFISWVDMGGIMATPEQRAPLFSLLALFSAIQCFLFFAALTALRSKRRTENWAKLNE